MSFRVVVVSGIAKLDYKMDYLVVRRQEGTKRVHLSEISVLVVESTAASLTSCLLSELVKRKVDIIFCDEKRLPQSTLLPLSGSHDSSLKLRRQIKWRDDIKALVWTEIIRAKITGQAKVLESSGHKQEALLLKSYIEQLEVGDVTNREGHAAKVYFNALFGMSFSRSLDNNINAALNYGYSILLSVCARETAANGYATQLGIFHDNMYNAMNLPCDIMEPFRPFIDILVLNMELENFDKDEKITIISSFNRQISIDGANQYMLNAIKFYTKSVFKAIEEADISLLKFPKYEL